MACSTCVGWHLIVHTCIRSVWCVCVCVVCVYMYVCVCVCANILYRFPLFQYDVPSIGMCVMEDENMGSEHIGTMHGLNETFLTSSTLNTTHPIHVHVSPIVATCTCDTYMYMYDVDRLVYMYITCDEVQVGVKNQVI